MHRYSFSMVVVLTGFLLWMDGCGLPDTTPTADACKADLDFDALAAATNEQTSTLAKGDGAPADEGMLHNAAIASDALDLGVRRSLFHRNRMPREGRLMIDKSAVTAMMQMTCFPSAFRAVDGYNNNLENPAWGAAGVAYLRMAEPAYADGEHMPAGENRPSARAVSNMVIAQSENIVNLKAASGFVWQWGQFVDHDIDETPIADPAEAFDVAVPMADPWFDPEATGEMSLPLDRSGYTMIAGVREQLNVITAYLDASNVYGSDEERATALRAMDGSGRLRTSAGDLLPFNDVGMENAPDDSAGFFLAGDIRANEQVGLTSMHTLFMREHNFWADQFATIAPELNGDERYAYARAMVAAELQAITYREFLPMLLGGDALPPYEGYQPEVNAGITNEFATAAYRVGHSMLSAQMFRMDADGEQADAGPMSLADAFFNPQAVMESGIEPFLRGLAAQPAQDVDGFVVDEVRNFLFGPPGAGGLDLASLNIQRGRDHGLPVLNDMREALGMRRYAGFADLTGDADLQAKLAAAYDSVDDIDLWVGGLIEQHMPGALVGETWMAIIADQFTRLRDGDRFWYESYLPAELVELVEAQTLAKIIKRNTAIGDEMPDGVFQMHE